MKWLRSFDFTEADLDSLQVDKTGGIFYACSMSDGHDHQGCTSCPKTSGGAAGEELEEETPVASGAALSIDPFPASLVFHSRPGAPNVIYLNFCGETVTGTAWNSYVGRDPIVARVFSTDTDTTTFSDTEQAIIKKVWQRVAEDYAPFNINVTTERPADFGTNSRVAMALITRNTDVNGAANPMSTATGVAYINVFGQSNFATTYKYAWVYHNQLNNDEHAIGEVASHEIGHNMGLDHDGQGTTEYYAGHGGTTGGGGTSKNNPVSWGPIMGKGYWRNMSHWSKGEYYNSVTYPNQAGSNSDDLFIIAGKIGYRPDDHGDTFGDATPLVSVGGTISSTTPENDINNSNPANKGVIEQNTDVDVFRFYSGAGSISLTVTPLRMPSGSNTRGGNLDVLIELYNSSGTLLASSNPSGETDAVINHNVSQGYHYLVVKNTGVGDPFNSSPTGYTAYGSIGQYFINGSTVDAEPPPYITSQTPLADSPVSGSLSQIAATFSKEMDPASFSLAEDILSFTGPSGTDLASAITGSAWSNGNTTLTINFNAQSGIGYYRLVLGPQIKTPSGLPLDQNLNGIAGEEIEDRYVALVEVSGGSSSQTIWSDLVGTDGPDAGWVFSGGSWASGTPTSNPATSADGGPIIAQNLAGDYNAGENSNATSPVIDASGYSGVSLSFKEWKGAGKNDILSVEAYNGSSWSSIYSYTGPNGGASDSAWSTRTIDISAHADNNPNLKLRWSLADTTAGGSDVQTGWQMDAIVVTGTTTATPAAPRVVAHSPSGTVTTNPNSIWLEFSNPMDETGFALGDITSFNGPAGSITASGFAWIDSTTLRIDFPAQSTIGSYSLALSSQIPDLNGTLLDQDGNGTPGEASDTYTASFTIPDAPLIASLSPADNATEVQPGAHLIATFNKSITAGSGNITIRNLTDNITFATIAIGDGSQISIASGTLTINPTGNLALGKTYAVWIDSMAVKDTSNNLFAGISDDSTWNFTVTSITPGSLAATPSTALEASGYAGGPFTPASTVYALSNTGGSAIDWTASKSAAWLTVSPASGTLAAGATVDVTVTIGTAADSLASGSYSDTLSFANTTNGSGDTIRSVSLTVTTPPTYTVTYNGNSHTDGSAPASQTKTHNADLILAGNAGNLVRFGYSFAGWNTAADGSGTNYGTGATYTQNADLTLYARWNTPPSVNAGTDQRVLLTTGTPWSPADMSTLAWYDASDAATISQSSGGVSQWRDKSANSVILNHANQSTASLRPVTGTRTINGLNTLDFNPAANSNLDMATGIELLGKAVYVVAQADVLANQQLLSSSSVNVQFRYTLTDGVQLAAGINPWKNDEAGSSATQLFNTLNPNVVGVIADEELAFSVNGQETLSGNSHTGSGAFVLNQIGLRSTGSEGFDGRMGEIIICNIPAAGTRRQIEGYLAHKWGLAGSLPVDHPYKLNSPGASAATVTLNGTVGDLENDPLSTIWTLVSGPAAASFADANAVDTMVTFTQTGTYTLRLSASDSTDVTTDDVVITVLENKPYNSWVVATFTDGSTDTTAGGNPDGDNLTNLQEYAFGMDPTNPTMQALDYIPGGEISSAGPPIILNFAAAGETDDYRAVFVRRKDHVSAGLSYSVQFSADLGLWTTSAAVPTVLTNDPGDLEVVSVPYPASVDLLAGGTGSPGFFRVAISSN